MSTRLRLALLVALVCLCSRSYADWINLTGSETAANVAEIYIVDDAVKLFLENYVGDLADLLPDDWLTDPESDRPSLAARLRRFSEEGFQFVTNDGMKLAGKLELAEPRLRVDRRSPFAGMINPYTRQRVPGAPADKRVLYVEVV